MNETPTPRAWIGCLNCYNAGRLTGEWFDCEDLAALDDDELLLKVHRNGRLTPFCEELWGMDGEHMPFTGEFSPASAREVGERFAEIGGDDWDAYRAYARGMGYAELPDAESFRDALCAVTDGTFRDWVLSADFPFDPLEGLDLPDDSPARLYFDWDAYARDLAHEFHAEEIEGGRTAIFYL